MKRRRSRSPRGNTHEDPRARRGKPRRDGRGDGDEQPRKRSREAPDAPPSKDARGGLEGWLSVHPRGFAFATLEDRSPDVFVPATKLGTALHGDRVRLQVFASERGREGRVLEVLDRSVRRLVGSLRKRGKRLWIEPEDPRMPGPVQVVGHLPLGVRPGHDVIASIDRYPEHPRDGLRVRVLSGIAPRGSAASEIERIEIREGIEEEFPADALREAQAFGSHVRAADCSGRDDLEGLDFVTIDPEDARDHDDAVYATPLPRGGFRVQVAIADVSHYVAAGGALDRAALARSTSIYLPGRVVPMLPFELSSQLASLVPDERRLALVVEADVGPRGAVRRSRFRQAVIRSRARLTYAGVARALSLTERGPRQPEAESRLALLQTLFDASAVLRQRRRRRGALEFELPEPAIQLDEQGEPADIMRARSDPGLRQAYGMIEDLMLLANEVVATELSRRSLPTIYRVHAPPDPERIDRFAELAHSLGFALDPDAETDPRKLAELLRSIEGSESAAALSYLLLRSMQQATYSVENIGHFALAASHYLHFTSPIRRYPDLAVHRIVRALLTGERLDRTELRRELARQASISSRMERRAQSIDREIAKLYGALLLRDRVGERFDATIASLDRGGLWLTIEHPFVEAYCPLESLGHRGYRPDPLGLHLVAERSGHRLSVGQSVEVILSHVSIEDRFLSVRIDASHDAAEADGEERSPRRAARHDAHRERTGKADRRRAARKAARREKRRGEKRRGEKQRGQKRRGEKRDGEKRRAQRSERKRSEQRDAHPHKPKR